VVEQAEQPEKNQFNGREMRSNLRTPNYSYPRKQKKQDQNWIWQQFQICQKPLIVEKNIMDL